MNPLQTVEYVIDTFEGKVANDPDDRGGLTNWGITLPFLRRWRPRATEVDLLALTREEAVQCAHMVLMIGGALSTILDWRLRLVTFDFSFHAGEDDGVRALQRALNDRLYPGQVALKVDGIYGPKTQAAANYLLPYEAQNAAAHALALRQEFHIQQSYKPRQDKYLRGWLRRCTVLLSLVTRSEEGGHRV